MISKIQFRLQFLVLLWGFTGVFGKLVTMNALPMVWYRVLIAAIAIFIYMKFKKIEFKVSKEYLFKLLGIGAIVGIHWFTFYLSIKLSKFTQIRFINAVGSSDFTALIAVGAGRASPSLREVNRYCAHASCAEIIKIGKNDRVFPIRFRVKNSRIYIIHKITPFKGCSILF